MKNPPRETLILMIDSYTAWSFSSTGDDPANISSSGTEGEESTEGDPHTHDRFLYCMVIFFYR